MLEIISSLFNSRNWLQYWCYRLQVAGQSVPGDFQYYHEQTSNTLSKPWYGQRREDTIFQSTPKSRRQLRS
jgi:hypothetical protein